MQIRKEIRPFVGAGPVYLLYASGEYQKADAETLVYTMRKLSVLLTDDLAAVVGNQVFNTVRGDFFVFNPTELHHGRFLRSGLHRYLDFYIPDGWFEQSGLFDPACAAGLTEPFAEGDGRRVNLVHPGDGRRAGILDVTERLAGLAQAHPDPEDHAADLLLFAMMVELLDICAQAHAEQKANPPASVLPAAVSCTLRYIDENYAEPVSLALLARQAGCSVTYLTRTFRHYTGRTVHACLTERRVAAAQRLLLDGATTTEACYGAGFGDCSNFIRVFRRLTGCTPGRFGKD